MANVKLSNLFGIAMACLMILFSSNIMACTKSDYFDKVKIVMNNHRDNVLKSSIGIQEVYHFGKFSKDIKEVSRDCLPYASGDFERKLETIIRISSRLENNASEFVNTTKNGINNTANGIAKSEGFLDIVGVMFGAVTTREQLESLRSSIQTDMKLLVTELKTIY